VVREALELWLKRWTIAEKVRRHREGYTRHPVGPNEFARFSEPGVWPKESTRDGADETRF
jgi:hypothetical protein